MEYHMLYVKSRKSFEVRKKIITLPCAKIKHTAKSCFAVCQKKTHGKVFLCRVLKKSTQQRMTLPCALVLSCVFLAHSAKIMFAVCP